jgi:hypothetical protein
MAQLPVVKLSRPDPPEMEMFHYPGRQNVYSEVAFGSYISPEIDLFAGRDVGSDSRITTHIDHHSSDGHLRGGYGAFRNLSADVGLTSNFNAGRLTVDVGGETNFNNFYPVSSTSNSSDFRNEYDGAHFDIAYSRMSNSYEGWTVQTSYDLFEVRSKLIGSTAQTREQDGSLKGVYQWTGDRLHELYRIDIVGEVGQFAGNTTNEGWYRIGADVGYERLFNHNWLLSGQLGLHGAEEPNGGQLLLPTSRLSAKYWLGSDLTLRANFETSISSQSLKSRFDENPFILAHQPQFANSYRIGGGVKASYQPFNRLLLAAQGSYHHIRDYAIMARGNSLANLWSGGNYQSIYSNFYKTFYENVRVAELRFSLTYDLIPHTFWTDITGTLRDHKLTEGTESSIPYLSDYSLKSSIYLKPIESFRIQLWGEYFGPRSATDRVGDLDAYFQVGSRFEYRINDQFGAFIRGKNILDQQYQVWEGYQARPLQLYGGVTISL